MLDEEKLERLRAVVKDDTLDIETLATYLDMAREKILNRLYPMADIHKLNANGERIYKLPCKYDNLHIELTSRYIFRRGFEGQTSSNENGIGRQYGSENDEDLLKEVVQTIGVF